MTALISETSDKEKIKSNLFKEYPQFYSDYYQNVKKAVDDFFRKNFTLKLIGVSSEDNILFYGDEYFVHKTKVNKSASIVMRLSSSLVSSILDSTLGASEDKFSLKNITDIEANLLDDFTNHIYKHIEPYLNKTEANKKLLKTSNEYNLTFYVRYEKEHAGKLIITIPEYMLNINPKEIKPIFEMEDFKTAEVSVSIGAGSTKAHLNDIKALEEGDIILLEDSDINKMAVLWNGETIKFPITPNPSLIISIDSNGGDEMEEEQNTNSPNMWDSILVDIVAEFDNVKLTLGELKQISEGLVIDVGSVYDNKIKLRVENQVVATGELVILNDRYGVRIDKVKKNKEEQPKKPQPKAEKKQPEEEKKPASKPADKKPAPSKKATANAKKPAEGDENFDYSDFEIEDESI